MSIQTDGGLIPARFLTLLAHLIVLIILIWSRVRNSKLSSHILILISGRKYPRMYAFGILSSRIPSKRYKVKPINKIYVMFFNQLIFRLLIGLCTAVALIIVELFGFLSGLSMFLTTVSAICILFK